MSLIPVASTSAIKALLSGGGVVAIDSYYTKSKGSYFSTDKLKRGGYQGLASFASNSVEGMIKPLLPVGWKISSMYMKPIVVGATFTILAALVDGNKSMEWVKYNFITSLASEIAADFLEKPLESLINPNAPKISAVHSVVSSKSKF